MAFSHTVVGCGKDDAQNTTSQTEAAPVEVGVVERRDLPIEVTAIGTVEAINTVAVLPQVSGRITQVEFEEGAFVKRGDPLFTIDTRAYSASLSAAQAELAGARAAAAQARAEAERYAALEREGLASQQERTQRQADLEAAQAAIKSARAAIATASLNVQFTTLRSPIDGRTGELLVTVGNIVQPGGTEPLVVIRSLAPVKVGFEVPPTLLSELQPDGGVSPLEVRATTRRQTPVTTKGRLTFTDNSIDPLSGTLRLKATFGNADQVLWPGDFVDVVLVVGMDKQAVVAPEAAVAEGQRGAYAYVVDEKNIAHFRSVTIQRRTDKYVVIEKGLEPGEKVVTNGRLRLRDGTSVAPKTPAADASLGNSGAPPTGHSTVTSSSGSALSTGDRAAHAPGAAPSHTPEGKTP